MSKRGIFGAVLTGGVCVLLVLLLRPFTDDRWHIGWDARRTGRKERYLEAVEEAVGSSVRSAGAQGAPTDRRREPPNVILILADDLARTDISLYGGPIETPNIDRIGREGVTFTQASATTSICAPSRAAILTGRYQQRMGFELQPHDRYARNRLEYLAFRYLVDTGHMVPIANTSVPSRSDRLKQGLPPSEITLPELLGARGYRAAAYGKWHLGYTTDFSPLRFGFDEHYGFYEAFSLYAPVSDEGIVDTPIDDFSDRHMWRRGRKGASAIVHNDAVVEEPEYLTFRFAELAVSYIGDRVAAESAEGREPFFLYLPFNAPHTPLQAPREYVDRFSGEPDPVRRTYLAMIAALDDAVGQILAAVDRTGIAEHTMIVFASDNGGTSYLGVTDNGPLAGGKFTTFEGGLAVPFMIRYPGMIEPGARFEAPVSLMDIYATVEAATRLTPVSSAPPIPERPPEFTLDGVDLLPYVRGAREGMPHDALCYRSIYNHAVRSGRWKLVVNDADNPTGRAETMLFDLASDPSERQNLASVRPEVVSRLKTVLRRWEDTLAEPLWPPVMHFYLDVWGSRYWFAIWKPNPGSCRRLRGEDVRLGPAQPGSPPLTASDSGLASSRRATRDRCRSAASIPPELAVAPRSS